MTDIVATIRECERERCEATRKGDGEALRRILDPKVRYVHTNALVDTRESYIENAVRPGTQYLKMEWSNQTITPLGENFAMVTGRMDQQVHTPNQDFFMTSEALSIWSKDASGRWTLIAYQPTRLPD